jgi:hypothetical protein
MTNPHFLRTLNLGQLLITLFVNRGTSHQLDVQIVSYKDQVVDIMTKPLTGPSLSNDSVGNVVTCHVKA